MAGPCLYGSSVKSGVNPANQVVISRAAWETLTGAASSWLDTILDTFTPSIVKVSDLCALNPEDPPDLGLSTIASAIAGDPLSLGEVETWAKAKLTYYQFTQLCVCNAAPVTDPCCGYTVAAGPVGPASGSGSPGLGVNYNLNVIPVGSSPGDHITITYTQINFAALNLGVDVQAFSYPSGALLYSRTINSLGAGGATFTATVAAGDDHVGFLIHPKSGTDSWLCNSISGSCVGTGCSPTVTTPPATVVPAQPTTLVLPPNWACSTTSDICTRLQQVSDRLDWLRRDVTILQRYSLPFAYVQGAVHAGLTGVGSLVILDLVGLLVDVTTPPAGKPVLPGNPPYLWDCGWMSINDSNGMLEEKRITRSGYVWLPRAGQAATSFNYALDPGVVIRVVELHAEP